MKKSLFFIMLFASFAGFSQAITVNTTTYTADGLVNSVLINSPCTSGTNVVAKTGTDFGSVQGIGYFENTSSNPNFPFANGVVLSTGDVTKIPGVNPATPNTTTLSDGNAAWTGDADLQNILLSQSGVTFNSTNASSLEFQFNPQSASFSFDFLFASEEYGLLQCNFSDAFAFILTDLNTGTPVNLAIIGANSPISVASIRDQLYNSNCPSVNPTYFGAYNGPGFGPAINFNGQTIKMTASAVLDITHTYRIKLVIADGVDSSNNPSPLYDSAVFLGANTFNIGTEVLGIDYTPTNATAAPPRDAICAGSPMPVLQPVTPLAPGTTYQWYAGSTLLPTQTGPSLNLTALGFSTTNTYTLVYTQPSCVAISDEILVEVYSAIGAGQPKDLYVSCSAAATHSFDLSQNTTFLMATLPSDTVITYYANSTDAASGTGTPLPIPYVISHANAVSGTTVYARIKSGTSPCYEVKSFLLKYIPDPVVNIPAPDPANNTKCASNDIISPPKANFNLTLQTAAILGAQTPASAYVVKFYTSEANAIAGGAAGLIAGSTNFSSATRDIFVRIEVVGNPTCFGVAPAGTPTFSLTVIPKAHIDKPDNVVICSTSGGYQLPPLTDVTAGYFDDDNGTGNQLDTPAETLITTSQTIYLYNDPGGNFCSNKYSFTVTVIDIDDVTPNTTTPICSSYTLPTLPSYAVYVPNNAPPGPGNLPIPAATEYTTTTTLYVWTQSTAVLPDPAACSESKPFTITIIPFTPIDQADYPNQFDCNSYLLGDNMPNNPQVTYWTGPNQTGQQKFFGNAITVNGTAIYLHQSSGTVPNCTNDDVFFTVYTGNGNVTVPNNANRCSSFTLPPLPVGEYHTASQPNGGGTTLLPGSSITTAGVTTIWVYIPGESCTYTNSFTVTINLDAIPPIADVPAQCDYYLLPANPHLGDYYTGPGGTGTKVANHNNDNNYLVTGDGVHQFYLYQHATSGNCFVEEPFTVTINTTPVIDVIPDQKVCNSSYTLPTLTTGSYYSSPGGVGPITNPVISSSTTTTQTIYIFEPGTTPGICDAQNQFTVTIVNTQVNAINDVYACESYALLPITGPGDYYDAPGGPAGGGTKLTLPYTITNNTTGTTVTTVYVYADDNSVVPCSDEKFFTVTLYKIPTVNPILDVHTCGSYTVPAYNTISTTPAGAVNHFYSGPGATGPELFPTNVINSSTTIYAYAGVVDANGDDACFAEQPIVLDITPYPIIAPAVSTIVNTGCDFVDLPVLTTGNYFNDALHASPITNLHLTASQTVYVYAVSATNNCETNDSFNVTVTPSPVLTITPATIAACDSYVLPAYNDAMFATTFGAVDQYNLASGTQVFPGNTISSSEVITVTAHNGTCTDTETLTINISVTPVLAPVTNLSDCDDVTLPALLVGNYYNDALHTDQITDLTLEASQTVYVYAVSASDTNCFDSDSFTVTVTATPVINPLDSANVDACGSYFLPPLVTTGATYNTAADGSGATIPVNTEILTSSVVYIYAINGTCPSAPAPKNISIYNVELLGNQSVCDPYILPALTTPNANYYTLPGGAAGGGQMLSAGDPIATTQTIYINGTSPGGCQDETFFTVTKLPDATVNPVTVAQTTVCDSDADPDDFVTEFDLDSLTSTILGAQDPLIYDVAYYPSQTDAQFQTNEIATDGTTVPDSSDNPVWVRVSNGTACEAIDSITITVVPQPHSDPLSGTICIDSETGQVTAAYIESGYSSSLYSFDWTDSTGTTIANTPNLQTIIPGTYTLVVTANGVAACESAPITVTVIESAKPADVTFETTGSFTDHQTITVIATPYIGNGSNFLYSLDGGPEQTGNVFVDVTSGTHEITVSDANGCGATPVPITLQLINTPAYFTPNGDGVNDVWRIAGLDNQTSIEVSDLIIYDRFGKLVKQVNINSGDGWDGSLNGQPLPSTDYWFTVRYVELQTGAAKEYKSHFSLIR